MRNISQAIAWGHGQIAHPSQSWQGLCQSFSRNCYGVPGWAPSALEAWHKIPAKKRIGGHPSDAPRGAILYFDFSPYGHAMIATKAHAMSNDYYRRGMIDVVPRDLPHWNGAAHYVGASFWTPFGEMHA